MYDSVDRRNDYHICVAPSFYKLPLHEPNKTHCLRELILTDVKVNIIRM